MRGIYSKRHNGDTMDKQRVSVLGLVTTLLTLMVVLGGCTSNIGGNNTSKLATPTSTNATMPTTTNATKVTHEAPITVAQGQDFTVTRRTNPSTGYHWELRFDDKTLSLADRTFVSDPNPYNLVGVPGTETFTFRALTKGTTAITLNNVSPSQVVTNQTVYAVTVT
jgi:predicted secreted protein